MINELPNSVWDMPDGFERPGGRLPCIFSNWLLEGGELEQYVPWGPSGFQRAKLAHSLDDCRACRNTIKVITHEFSFGRGILFDLGFAMLEGTPDGEVYMVDPRRY